MSILITGGAGYIGSHTVKYFQWQNEDIIVVDNFQSRHKESMPATGLRFFKVYGPMGRPDMEYFGFTDKYFAGKPIRTYNNGDFEHDHYKDFAYVDDILEVIVRMMNNPPILLKAFKIRCIILGIISLRS